MSGEVNLDRLVAEHPTPWRLIPEGTLRLRIDDAQGLPIRRDIPSEGPEANGAIVTVALVNRLADVGPFVEAAVRTATIDANRRKLRDMGHTRQIVEEHLSQLAYELKKGTDDRSWVSVRQTLLSICAATIQAVRQFKIEHPGDAIAGDIP